MTRKKDYPCLKCDVHVKKNDAAIQCILCELWVHQKCADISDALFKELVYQAEHNGGATWSCKACRSASTRFNKQITEIYKKVETLEAAKEEHDKEIQTLKHSVETIDTKMVRAAEKSREDCDAAQNSVFRELRDREERKRNVIIHNLEEPGPEVVLAKDRKNQDNTSLQKVLDTMEIQIDAAEEVKFIRRIGDKDGDRPLLVGFRDKKTQETVLQYSYKLQDSDFSEVNIIPDLTKRQRQEDEDVRLFCEEKNSARTGSDLNFYWKAVGPKGQKRALRVKAEGQTNQRGRGRGRGRTFGRGRPPAPARGTGRRRLPSEKRGRNEMEEEEDVQEVEMEPPAKK